MNLKNLNSEISQPSNLVLCGPQTRLPGVDAMRCLHQVLLSRGMISKLLPAVVDNQHLLHRLVDKDPQLSSISNTASVTLLEQWLQSGYMLENSEELPNYASLPLIVLLQIALYLYQLGNSDVAPAEEYPVDELKQHGVQGFCVGLLAATAIAFSTNDDQLAKMTAVSMRLAMCIGAYVDADASYADPPAPACALSARWQKGDMGLDEMVKMLVEFPRTYISCITDETCVTITTQPQDSQNLARLLKTRGVRVRPVPINGRFHSASDHESAAQRIQEFCRSEGIAYPDASDLKIPLRCNSGGFRFLRHEEVAHTAVSAILLETADWYGTVKAALEDAPARTIDVISLALGESILPVGLSSRIGSQHVVIESIPPPPGNGPEHAQGGYPPGSIAVIGMACRLPGADSVDAFWDLLASGANMVREPPSDRLNLHGGRWRGGGQFWGNFIDDPDVFDNRFFNKSSREAASWDPEQRVLLEVAYQALESAGHFGPCAQGVTGTADYGCYIGVAANNYYDNVACHPPSAYSLLGTSRAFFSGRVSHQFGLTGPAMSIDTACSSSLVAINLACKAIQAGECSGAIAGGTNIFTSPYDYQNLAAAGFLSPTGSCKPFDASADGYCRGEGVAVVVLKPMCKALADGDNILGVILGSAVNQNLNDAHIAVPCAKSQAQLYRRTLDRAGVRPSDVTYFEAHGTGTQVGDPIELQSIREVFGGASRAEKLYLGAVKAQIGHTEPSAGVSGFIKTLLMMQHRTIVGQSTFRSLNPKIPPLEQDMMEIPKACLNWGPSPRIAVVSSYGAAGSNAVVAVREAPAPSPKLRIRGSPHAVAKQPLFLAAASEKSLVAYAKKMVEFLRVARKVSDPALLSDVLFALADRANHALSFSTAKTVLNLDDLEASLLDVATGRTRAEKDVSRNARPTVLVFGGQESDRVGLSRQVYDSVAVLRHHLNDCNKIAVAINVGSIFPAVFQQTPLGNLPILHATLFSVQYSTARCWIDCGIAPAAVVGHSFGQYAALCISGCLSLADALKLVVGRARLIESAWGPEPGTMLSVQADSPTLSRVIASTNRPTLEIACYNHPTGNVVVGSDDDISALEDHLVNGRDLPQTPRTRRLNVTNGFHSVFTEPLLPELREIANGLQWNSPSIHIELCRESATESSPQAWLIPEHTRKPVFFSHAIDRLSKSLSSCVWLEAGMKTSVISLVRSCLTSDPQQHAYFPSALGGSDPVGSLAELTVDLWKARVQVQHWPYHRSQKQEYGYRSLPPYQFEKTRHWIPLVERTRADSPGMDASAAQHSAAHEFISFMGYKDDGRKAVFLIDPESERYKMLAAGHRIFGQFMAPFSLNLEFPARAALHLTPEAKFKTHVISVNELETISPVTLDSDRDIIMTMSRATTQALTWSFIISSRPRSGGDRESTHLRGSVSINKRGDPILDETMSRWGSLVGYQPCLSILHSDEAEGMQGKHIYHALKPLFDLDEMYQGVKSIASIGKEAVGKIIASPDPHLGPDEDLYDAPVIHGLMQMAPILVNHFRRPRDDVVWLCLRMRRIITGSTFNIHAGKWIAYSLITEETAKHTTADVYIFDGNTEELIMAFLGCHFSATPISTWQRRLRDASTSVNKAQAAEMLSSQKMPETPAVKAEQPQGSEQDTSTSKRDELYALLHHVADIPIDELRDDSSLESIGIDSLMVTEVLSELKTAFLVDIDLDTMLAFENLGGLVSHIDSALGILGDGVVTDTRPQAGDAAQSGGNMMLTNSLSDPSSVDFSRAFEECRKTFDGFARETKAVGFWKATYPSQARLVLAYILEALASLGCDLSRLEPDQAVPEVLYEPRHSKVVRQLFRILEDGGLVSCDGGGRFLRTAIPADPEPASAILKELLSKHPQHECVHKLVQATGSELAACLAGKRDATHLLFGNKATKRHLDDLYLNWPLFRSATLVLGRFLKDALSNAPTTGRKFRILEVGAGTAGTSKFLVRHLTEHGIPFEYVFTDLSASLVAQARRNIFRDTPDMEFRVLDIEEEPPQEWLGAFDAIVSSNCVHATRNLTRSLTTLRRLLRGSGVLALVEITRNMFWLDIVFGLLEGWWLFDDGREHAVSSEVHWKMCMLQAGFQKVEWSEGDEPESDTVRVIAAFLDGSRMY